MIIIQHFRRTRWDYEGVTGPGPVTAGPSLALACHKGDASQSQSETQLGAQTQGVNNQGTGNVTNTGTSIVGHGAVVITNTGSATNNSSTHGASTVWGASPTSPSVAPAPSVINTGTQIGVGSTINNSTVTISNDADIVAALNQLGSSLATNQTSSAGVSGGGYVDPVTGAITTGSTSIGIFKLIAIGAAVLFAGWYFFSHRRQHAH